MILHNLQNPYFYWEEIHKKRGRTPLRKIDLRLLSMFLLNQDRKNHPFSFFQ